jgi:hypothetical protein
MFKYILPALLAFSVNASFAEDLVIPQKPEVKQEKPGVDVGLNKEEWMKRAAVRFEELDVNKDGKVTREEELAGLHKIRERVGKGEQKGKGKGPKGDAPAL